MENPKQELQYGPESDTWIYPPPVPCPGCGGSGKVTLLVTARACKACGGSGQAWPEPRHQHVPPKLGYWRRKRTCDALGRLIVEARWFEPVGDAEKGDAGSGPEAADGGGPNETDGPKE